MSGASWQFTVSPGVSTVLGSPTTFLVSNTDLLPQLMSSYSKLVQASQTSTQAGNAFDLVLWNFGVASAEESFKVALTNLGAMWLIAKGWFQQKTGAYVSSFMVVGIWTFLHSFQSITNINGLLMAYCAGYILLGMTFIFKSMIPAVITHWLWNVMSSILP